MPAIRIGTGYDVHRLVHSRRLMLGGVEIPFEKGLLGHSDADVLLHAICDALLGALAMGDIGQHFPDTDPRYKNIQSSQLLSVTWNMIQKAGFEIANIDSTIFAQAPRLAPYRAEIRQSIAGILRLKIDQISVKATTTEALGPLGRREGIAAAATVLLKKKETL